MSDLIEPLESALSFGKCVLELQEINPIYGLEGKQYLDALQAYVDKKEIGVDVSGATINKHSIIRIFNYLGLEYGNLSTLYQFFKFLPEPVQTKACYDYIEAFRKGYDA